MWNNCKTSYWYRTNVDTLFTSANPGINVLSTFQLTYSRPPKVLLEIKTNPQEVTSRSFKQYLGVTEENIFIFSENSTRL